jgi:RNA polymerase sigma-70 factor (ECF subfamily)
VQLQLGISVLHLTATQQLTLRRFFFALISCDWAGGWPLCNGHGGFRPPAGTQIMVSHNGTTHLPPIDDFAARLIRFKARQLVGRAGFTRSDVDDIEQELVLKLLKHRGAFDPDQSHWHAFVTTIVERHAATILRDKRMEKRDFTRATSLHVIVDDPINGPSELAATIGRRELDARLGLATRPEHDFLELVQDLATVMADLPPTWRNVCERLKSASVSKVARDLGVPRTTLSCLLRRLRRRFEPAGLGEYVKPGSSDRAATE